MLPQEENQQKKLKMWVKNQRSHAHPDKLRTHVEKWKMPGTVHDSSAIDVQSMWKVDGVVQLSDEIELKVIIIQVT